MKAREIMETASGGASAGASTAGSMAVAVKPMGTISRNSGSLLTGKYVTDSDPTPNTPKEYKRNKHVSGRFKNTPGN
jgi:hypothetical protein